MLRLRLVPVLLPILLLTLALVTPLPATATGFDFDTAVAYDAEHGQGDENRGPRNVRIIASLYRAFAEGDTDTILEIIDPDVVWIEADGIPYGGTFIGRDAVFEGVFGKIAAEWTDFTAEAFEFIHARDRVIVLGRDSGTFNATGKSMTAPTASIWTLERGRVVHFIQYLDNLAVFNATQP